MGLWVRNEKKLIMQCWKEIWKDVRAVRSASTTQEPRRALRITRLLFEILLLCLRRTWLERKSPKNRSKVDENPAQTDPKSTKNRSCAILGAQGCIGDASGPAWDSFGTPKCRPKADLGAPRASQERPGDVQKLPRAARKCSKTLRLGRPSACGALSGFTHVFRSIFGRFRLVARKPRGASRTSFYSVLLSSHKVHTERT